MPGTTSHQEALRRLKDDGHLEGAGDSLLGALQDRLADGRETARLDAVRAMMLRHLRTMHAGAQDCALVQGAPDLAALWALRDRFTTLVQAHYPAARAARILTSLTTLFVAHPPAG